MLFGTKQKVDFHGKIIDVHSHILPGMDDGARNPKQSKAMLDQAWAEGIKTIIATPHRMPERQNASPEKIKEISNKLQHYSDKKGYGIKILTGNEIYFCEETINDLEQGQVCTMADSDCVLVEFAPVDDAVYIRNGLLAIQNMGYRPILAHVERYSALCKSPFDKVAELRNMGVLIQVNSMSVTGNFGRATASVVEKLLKKKLVDFISTDAHSDGKRSPAMKECVERLNKICSPDYIEKLLYGNAEEYIL